MVYIGRTQTSIEQRWKQHCRDVKRKHAHFKLQSAIDEFGPENFAVEQIDYADTKEEADEKEMYWIKNYNATETGYNTSPGGRNGGHRKKVKSVEDNIVFDTMVEAGKFYGVSSSTICCVVDKPHLRAGGQHWISL